MKKNYDFSKAVSSPYAKRLKRQLMIKLDEETIGYFQNMAEDLANPISHLNEYVLARVCRFLEAPASALETKSEAKRRLGIRS